MRIFVIPIILVILCTAGTLIVLDVHNHLQDLKHHSKTVIVPRQDSFRYIQSHGAQVDCTYFSLPHKAGQVTSIKARKGPLVNHWSSLSGKPTTVTGLDWSEFDDNSQLDYKSHGEAIYMGSPTVNWAKDTLPAMDEDQLGDYLVVKSLFRHVHWDNDEKYYYYMGKFIECTDLKSIQRYTDSMMKYMPDHLNNTTKILHQ